MSTERKVRRKVVNFKEADFETYSLQGKPQADLWWHNISWSDEDDSGFFLIKFDPGGVSIPHEHLGYEEFVILEGELSDHDGWIYRPGDCVFSIQGIAPLFDFQDRGHRRGLRARRIHHHRRG